MGLPIGRRDDTGEVGVIFPNPRNTPPVDVSDELLDRETEINERRDELQQSEFRAREEINVGLNTMSGAVDRRLQELLADTGIQAGEVKQQVGEQFSARGLNRSSFATEKVAEVNQATISQGAQLRVDASRQKQTAEINARNTIQDIQDRRLAINIQMQSQELAAFTDAQFKTDLQNLNNEYKSYLANLQIEAMNQPGIMDYLFNSLGPIGDMLGMGANLFGVDIGQGDSTGLHESARDALTSLF